MRRHLKVGAIAVGVGVVTFLSAWVVDDVVNGTDIRRGTHVAGFDVGGLDRDQATEVIEELSEAVATTTIDLQLGDRTVSFNASALGVSLDSSATVAAAAAGQPAVVARPAVWLSDFFTDRNVAPVITVDAGRMAAAMTATDTVRGPPRIALDNGVFEPVLATEVPVPDYNRLAEILSAAVSADPGAGLRAPVPTSGTVIPGVEPARSLARRANQITADGARIRLQGTEPIFTIDPDVLRELVVVRDGPPAHLGLDSDRVDSTLSRLLAAISTKGTPATFALDEDGSVEIIGGEAGSTCCGPGAAEVLFDGLVSGRSVIEVPASPRPHPQGREWAASLGVEEVVGKFTTRFVAGQSRVRNIARISELTRGVLIAPGQQFSVNDFIGPRTRAKGFVTAGVIYRGVFVNDVGGGISQYATTLFNAAFFAGLDFVNYQSHSIYISRYPYGREATLSYPEPDLVIENNTPYTVMLWPTTTDSSITVLLYSTPWVTGEQTGQSRRKAGACTRVTTERTRTWLVDGRTETDTVMARYRPEGLKCDGTSSVPTTTTLPPEPEPEPQPGEPEPSTPEPELEPEPQPGEPEPSTPEPEPEPGEPEPSTPEPELEPGEPEPEPAPSVTSAVP